MLYNFLGFILGLICSFGQPPFNYSFSAICAMALFFYFLELQKTTKSILLFSFSFGYGYYLYSHHWLSESLLSYGDSLIWLFPLGVLFIPAFFALYTMLAGYLIAKFAKGNILSMAIIWLLVEYFRGYGYIESAWLLMGYIWSDSNIISQSAAVFSIWGLSFVTVLFAGVIYAMILEWLKLGNKQNISLILTSCLIFILVIIYGYCRLHYPPSLTSQSAKVRIVQANIDNNVHARQKNNHNNLLEHMRLSRDAGEKGIKYIIWPEGANEYAMSQDLLDFVKQIVPRGTILILSNTRIEQNPDKYWNSLFAINDQGKIIDSYDKTHLVALGEYIPLRAVLPFINKITPGSVDLIRGNGFKVIDTQEPFLPNICYESSFPESPKQFFTWIVNVTNDGWFGTSIGPYQHLAIAKFRAIEQGVPMVRAALTGISAVIDSFGRVTMQLPLLTKGVLDFELPEYLTNSTYYHSYGNCMILALLLISFIINRIICKFIL